MRHDHHLGAPIDQRRDCRREPLDTRGIGHRAIPYRHVQVGAQQHPFAAHIHVIERWKIRHPTATLSIPTLL